jgi:glycosyltransferase involved in cell wall biosynthesis
VKAAVDGTEGWYEDQRDGGDLHACNATRLPCNPVAEVHYVGAVKVVVLTTSYPRNADDPAGRFVADAVEGVRGRGVEVEVVSPASFRHFGLAYGHGIVGNIRKKPWRVLFVPAFLWSFRRAAARAARDADLVHAHWLAAGAVALTLRRPYVVQVWGTDVELARRVPWLVRPVLRRARLAIGASRFLVDEARALGAREVRVVPSGVAIPDSVGPPQEPPHVLFVGRLSEEKGILEFLEATEGMPRVIVGDGPLRDRVPEAVGFVPPGELGAYYERAAVVCCPSRREGYGVVAREAMAWGRPVVATAVGGLLDAVVDGETGVLVPPEEVALLRTAIERVLGDASLRRQLGSAARELATRDVGVTATAKRLAETYDAAIIARR